MYDYNNGRFLSVDPFIQSPSSTQSLNPYTYIQNNPLSGTDPTGYIAVPLVSLLLNPVSREVIRQVATKAARVATKALIAGVLYLSARIAQESTGVVFRVTCDSSCNNQNPGLEPADPSSTILSIPVADFIDSTEGFQQADPSPTNTPGPALDSWIGSTGILMNENSGDTSDTETSKPIFELDHNGTPDSIRSDLEKAGYPGLETTETQKNGTLHENVQGEGGEMDVRVMDGQSAAGDFKGPRVITTRPGTNDPVKSDGSKFRDNESKSQRRESSHT